MRIGTVPEQGDIVRIPVAYTDLSSQKRRPVVVISNSTYNEKHDDVVVVAMTSNLIAVDYSFTVTSADLEAGSLNRPGKMRADKIYTLSQAIIVKTFGRVNTATLQRIHETLQELTAPKQ